MRVQDCAGFVAQSGPSLWEDMHCELDLSERWTASAGSPLAGLSGFGKLGCLVFH
jgi:hypothetical protein